MADALTTNADAPVGSPAQPLRLPAEVELFREDVTSPSFTPRQLRAVKETYGRSFGEIAQAEDFDLQIVVVAWLKLQEEHGPFPVDLMDDVRIKVMADQGGNPLSRPDPTVGGNSPTSPHSAAIGDSPPATSTN